MAKALPAYTWEELAKHNTPESAWVSIHGKVYDVTEWAARHPGGSEYIHMSAGRDITDLYISYHPFTDKPDQVLAKFEIGTLSSYELNTFKPDSGFYKELKKEVGAYFSSTGLHYKSPWPGLWRLGLILLTMFITYQIIYDIIALPFPIKFAAAVVFGVCQALQLLHMMHDASHSSIGYSQVWWQVIGRFTMEWVAGASMTSWHHQHVLGHHIYTNIMGTDPDLPAKTEGDMRYLVRRQVWQQIYKYQYIYMPILYGLLAIKFRIQDLTDTFGSETNGAIRVNPRSNLAWIGMLWGKLLHFIIRFFVPYFILGVSLNDLLFYYMVTEMATGYFLAFNFQVSHVSTEAFFPLDTKYQNYVEQEWAVIQLNESVDYAHGNPIMSFLCGHLNYQIEHHLFPCVSQYHYPALAPIVKKVCSKWKVPYNYVPTFQEAIWTHLKYLYNMGNPKTVD